MRVHRLSYCSQYICTTFIAASFTPCLMTWSMILDLTVKCSHYIQEESKAHISVCYSFWKSCGYYFFPTVKLNTLSKNTLHPKIKISKL